MRRVLRFAFDDVRPADSEVLARIGMPANAPVTAALRSLMDEALTTIRGSAEPRGVYQLLSKDDFATIYRGEGRNAPESPLDLIAPRCEALALFVGTIGERAASAIELLFRNDDAALAMMLDAWASEMTNGLADALAGELLAALRSEGAVSESARVLPYSPGYCGWHLTGQRAIFARIRPTDIGVTLQPSCLMLPIKSVSGVLVAGNASVHRFRPAWAFCDECRTRDCGPRMRSVR